MIAPSRQDLCFQPTMTDSEQTTDRNAAGTGFEFETPFTIQHVQTHLILGPIARHVKVSTLVIIFASAYLLYGLLISDSVLQFFKENFFDAIWWAFLAYLFRRMTRQQQAIALWGSIKFAGGMGAFIVMTAGSLSSREFDPPGALPLFFLGLIWLPGLEFIPRLTPHQKYITLARFGLSILCIYFGIQRGAWI